MQTLTADLVFDAHARLGEGPMWDGRRSRLVWLDITSQQVHLLDPRTGSDRVYAVGGRPGCVAPRASGGLVVALEHGFWTLDLESGAVARLTDAEPGDVPNRMNDGKCDAAGRLWAGTMALNEKDPTATLYRLDPDLSVSSMLQGVTISNGLIWSADNRTLYYIDTPTHGVDAFDFDVDSGRIANRRRVVTVPSDEGFPDGMTIDADGCLWVSIWGGHGVHRYTPDGRLDRIVRVPAQFTSCPVFGGDALDELYITSAADPVPAAERAQQPHAGGVFVCRPGARGLPPNAFAG